MTKKYDTTTAQELLDLAFSGWVFPPYVIRDDGVYQSEEDRQASPSEDAFDWTPAYDTDEDEPNAPNPATAPMLPLPFGAPELAAFMLDGAGSMIPQTLGCRIGKADPDLSGFDHPHKRVVRKALRESFALLKQAVQRVGPPNYEEIDQAYCLLEQSERENGEANEREGVFEQTPDLDMRYQKIEIANRREGQYKKPKQDLKITRERNEIRRRRVKAINSVSELVSRAEQANATAKQNWRDWRRQMVHALLVEGIETSAEVTEFLKELEGLPKKIPATEQAQTAPVKSASSRATEVSTIDTTGMVAWQAVIIENWGKVTEQRGNAITARQVMEWCKKHGPEDVFPRDQPNNMNSIQWKDSDANVHTLTLSRIGTVVSELRKAGTIPPRK